MHFYLVFFVANTVAVALHLPLVELPTLLHEELSTVDFIDESYQPLVISGSLGLGTVAALAPWTFANLNTSLEATTTFCIASTGFQGLEVKSGDAGGHRGKTTAGDEGKEVDDDQRSVDDGGSQMSLRRFGVEGSGQWLHAVTNITKDIGSVVALPRLLDDADLAYVDLTKTGLHHVRAGWTEQVSGRASVTGAAVVCVLEGHVSLTLTPYELPWQHLKCAGEWCEVLLATEEGEMNLEDYANAFVTQASVFARACIYAPPGWQWSTTATLDTTFIWLAWKEDVVLREEVIDGLFPPDEESAPKVGYEEEGISLRRDEHTVKTGGTGASHRRRRRRSSTLWDVLPKSPSPPLLLWGDQNPLLHLTRRYLLTDQDFDVHAFLDMFRIDRTLLPDLVDCPRECVSVATTIFALLDTDADGVLTPGDATYWTQETFASLSHQLDDLVDELKELSRDQWVNNVEHGGGDTRQAFLERAKERLTASALASVKRWVAGDLEDTDEQTLKEKLPELYDQILAARGTSANITPLSSGSEEL
ncbi:uncharacterized protein [Panulirus ornatus]|uniref:uncharacterized protein isoform X2 n=1 Tax=Panulirus ornatus TaxID=150431 RepID=UPI003A882DB5